MVAQAPKKQPDKFNADKIAALLDKDNDGGGAGEAGADAGRHDIGASMRR